MRRDENWRFPCKPRSGRECSSVFFGVWLEVLRLFEVSWLPVSGVVILYRSNGFTLEFPIQELTDTCLMVVN